MRFFELWGAPSEIPGEGDIESFDYLFLGDFSDKGTKCLELICLLLALKVKYPLQIHLLRGHHEDIAINYSSLAEETKSRLGQRPEDPRAIFQSLNKFYDWLPLAAVIEDRVLCVHGGLGASVRTLEEIESVQRPISMTEDSVS